MILSKDIAKEWGVSTLSPEKQREFINRVSRVLYQAILVRSLEELTLDEEKELDSLLDSDSTTPEKVVRFLRDKIVHFDDLLKDERRKLKEDFVFNL